MFENTENPTQQEQEAADTGVTELIGQIVIVWKKSGSYIIGRLSDMDEEFLFISNPRIIHLINDPSTRRMLTGLGPYFPPFVSRAVDDRPVPLAIDLVENMFHPVPEIEAEWVKATSGLQLVSS